MGSDGELSRIDLITQVQGLRNPNYQVLCKKKKHHFIREKCALLYHEFMAVSVCLLLRRGIPIAETK